MGSTIVASRIIYALSASDKKTPVSMEIKSPKEMVMGSDARIYAYAKTKYGTPLVDFGYSGKYVLRSKKPGVRFCNISKRDIKTCGYDEFVTEILFTYDDTYRGALDVLVRTGNYEPLDLEVVVNGGKYAVMGKLKTTIKVTKPKDIDTKTAIS